MGGRTGKLFVPDYWNTLSDEAKRAAYNGVGPGYFPAAVRNLLDVIYHWAAKPVRVHDVEYIYSRSRVAADFRLLANCLIASRGMPRRLVLSVIAFMGVFLFGGKAWRIGHDVIRCGCD